MTYIEHKAEESLEDYLEAILILNQESSTVRSIDIATKLNYSKPSISVAMKKLKSKDFISISEEGYITLTDSGKSIAEKVYECHRLLTDWLVYLGVNPKVAAIDACKMEHDISPESYEAMKKCILSMLEK